MSVPFPVDKFFMLLQTDGSICKAKKKKKKKAGVDKFTQDK